MWRDRFNLSDDENEEKRPPQNDQEDDADDEENPGVLRRIFINEEYEGMYGQLFKVNLFMTAVKDTGEQSKVRIPLTVPDFLLGAFVETLHFNNIPYNCIPVEPEETGEENDEG